MQIALKLKEFMKACCEYGTGKKGMPEKSKSYPLDKKADMIENAKEFIKTLPSGSAVLVKGSRGMKMEEVFEALKESLTK